MVESLGEAIKSNDNACLQQLIENEIPRNKYKNTKLHLASKFGLTEWLKNLLLDQENPVNIEAKNIYGETALHKAAMWNEVDVVKFFLGSSSQHDHDDATSEGPPLTLYAIHKGQVSDLNQVLEADRKFRLQLKHRLGIVPADPKVNVNATDEKGRTPLHLAACRGHIEIVEQLLMANRIRPTIEDKDGKTPLECAFDNDKQDVQRRLSEELTVQDYVENLYRDRQVYVDAANAILVGAALIATVTFASWLQPPLGWTTYYGQQYSDPLPSPPTTYPQYASFVHHTLMQAFWVCNTLSFFCSIATVISGARSVLPSRRNFIKEEVRKLRKNLLVTSVLLVFSTAFVLAAFGLAGIVVVPPVPIYKINVYTTVYIGGICCFACLFSFARNIWHEWLFKSRQGRQGYPLHGIASTLRVWLWLVTCGNRKIQTDEHEGLHNYA